MTNSSQSQDKLDKILWNFAMKIGATRDKVMVGADNLESTKQLLLAWRRTTSLDKLPMKYVHIGGSEPDITSDQYKLGFNQAINFTKEQL